MMIRQRFARSPKQARRFYRTALMLLYTMAGTLTAQAPAGNSGRANRWSRDAQAVTGAAQAKNDSAHLSALHKLCSDFPENALALRQLLFAEQQAGKGSAAVNLLRQYAAMGMTLNPGTPAYEAMARAGLLANVPELTRNAAVTSKGKLAFVIPDSSLLVEDVAWDPVRRHFLVSSVHGREIVDCDSTGRCSTVIRSSPALQLDAILGIHVDSARSVIWAATAGLNAQSNFRPEYGGRSAVLKFDLRSHALIGRYSPNDGRQHALGDMTIASNGDAYISDGESGDVYVIRHDRDTLQLLVPHGNFVSPQTPALNADESLLYVPDYVEGIAVIHLRTGAIEWVKSVRPAALDGIDGLYWVRGGLIAIQNGTAPERVVRFHLSSYNIVDGFDVIDANRLGLGDPTHGVVVGDDFYYIANSGWDRVQGDGTFAPGAPAAIWRVRIGSN